MKKTILSVTLIACLSLVGWNAYNNNSVVNSMISNNIEALTSGDPDYNIHLEFHNTIITPVSGPFDYWIADKKGTTIRIEDHGIIFDCYPCVSKVKNVQINYIGQCWEVVPND